MNIEVLVELKAKSIDKTFTYSVPLIFQDKIKIGKRVLVPFGKQQLEGFILNINNNNYEYELKDIVKVIDEDVVLNKEMLELGSYISKKTLSNLITCYQTMLPKALKAQYKTNINKKYVTFLKLNKDFKPKSDKQKEIIDLFKEELVLKSKCNNISSYITKKLIEEEIFVEIKKEEYRLSTKSSEKNNKIVLTDEQELAIKKIETNGFNSYLLHGVTGSGKTEIYMNVIEKVIPKKEVIVLVPEISLTPQLIETFKSRFGNKIAILHSKLSDGERYDEWRKILNKEVCIVIGARSAIFAPFTNLGLIIVDEEHSSTYKQENNPRYNAIDVAIYRAKNYNCPIILGSATPSVESYTRAKTGVYKLIELKKRVNNSLPQVILIDMKEEIKNGNKILSSLMVKKIKEKLEKKEQIILLLNRRGYTTISTCKSCGFVHKCPYCDIPLTYHKSSNTMRCHYCGYGVSKLIECPNCKNKDIMDYGMGTEKLQQIINETFDAKTIRMDVDTTSTKNSHEKIINDFSKGLYDVLIGTQMVAKGLNFPKVTLVGVINGDATLNIPDFRSGERTFQLLNQVAGRAGRNDLKGEVIIQGFNVNHYSIIKASTHDYAGFYNEEMNIRRKLNYPPYCNISKIKIKGKNYKEIWDESNKIVGYLKNNLDKTNSVLGPSSPIVSKINNIFELQIILKYKDTKSIIKHLQLLNEKYKANQKINVEIDINSILI